MMEGDQQRGRLWGSKMVCGAVAYNGYIDPLHTCTHKDAKIKALTRIATAYSSFSGAFFTRPARLKYGLGVWREPNVGGLILNHLSTPP